VRRVSHTGTASTATQSVSQNTVMRNVTAPGAGCVYVYRGLDGVELRRVRTELVRQRVARFKAHAVIVLARVAVPVRCALVAVQPRPTLYTHIHTLPPVLLHFSLRCSVIHFVLQCSPYQCVIHVSHSFVQSLLPVNSICYL
jgi:hypothetical protein